MKAVLSVIFLCTIGLASANDLEDQFKALGIVPDIIDEYPSQLLEVTYYPSTVVKPGIHLSPSDIGCPPKVRFNATEGKLYTLLMIDEPRGKKTQSNFWFVINIPDGSVFGGEHIVTYTAPLSYDYQDKRNYVFLVYEQRDGPLVGKNISDFQTVLIYTTFARNFAKKYNLDLVAGNVFWTVKE